MVSYNRISYSHFIDAISFKNMKFKSLPAKYLEYLQKQSFNVLQKIWILIINMLVSNKHDIFPSRNVSSPDTLKPKNILLTFPSLKY